MNMNTKLGTGPGYMRRNEAAQYLGVAPRTLSDWQRRRMIPFIRAGRKCVLFRADDLDKALGRYRVAAVGE